MTPSRWQQIEELYHTALECEPGDRAALLARADPELRREVESLLAHESSKTGALNRPPWAGTNGLSVADSTVALITSGTQLGPYRIEGPLAAGGMGEVFRGVDTRLGRPVAVKTSREQFSARFDREARAISALNHPHICTLYDVGPNYLVMELCEGETLAARLKRGKLSIQETVRYGAQIADALAAAHAKGITHRDLKPSNIMLGKAGIKVLDFGLAKSAQDLTLTATRVVMGTPAYMAPEQRDGKECDARTDIYALGLVLYEMATGKRAEQGKMPLLDALPPQLAHIIECCLAPDPDDRWQSARDLQRELQWAATSNAIPRCAPEPGGARRLWLAWSVAAVLLLAFAGLSLLHFRETPPAEPNLRFTIPLPGNIFAGFVTLSPDGRRLAIQFATEGTNHLWLRSLDSPQLQLLPGTENVRAAFWSPDGESIGFFADAKLKAIPVAGGPPQVLCEGTGDYGGGTWNRDGVILFSTVGGGEPLRRVNASGGACTAATKPDRGHSHAVPEFLPDGKHFVYVVHGGEEATRGLYVASLDTAFDNSASRRLLADDSSAIFVPSTTGKKYGYLLFLRGSELMAQPFSAETLQLAGDVFPVAADASNSLNPALIAASASVGGILVYESNLRGSGLQLTWLDRSGKEVGKVGDIQGQYHVGLSPDGKMAATVRRDRQIWLYDLQHGGEIRFTSPPLTGSAPVWSPEGNLIAFGSGYAGGALYLKDASGGSKEELLLGPGNGKEPSDWSRDGRYLIYTEIDPKSQGDVWYLLDPLSKSSKPKPVKFQGTEAKESQGQLSPDGRWLAYASDETGNQEIYVRPFPSGPGRWKVSAGRGSNREPRWRRDGKELYFLEYVQPKVRLMAVPVQSGPPGDFRAGAAQALFEFSAIGTVTAANHFLYSPSPDGQRFLVNIEARDAAPTLNVVTNWEKMALGIK
jgi:eukaryotic-like serine/threonine-protein kinase